MELKIIGVNKSFQSTSDRESIEILNDISFTALQGRFICIVGPSGCGKTTLLRLIAGLDKPDTGRIMLAGQEVTAPLREIGYIFQEPALFPWRTVLRNVEFGLETAGIGKAERGQKAHAALELVELQDFGTFYPKEISGGMKQKAALAMALVVEPKILLMDEPFVSLDCQTRDYMQVALLELWQKTGKTVIFVTHNVEEAIFLGDEIICLTGRPGAVGKVIDVNIPRPRDRTGREINTMRKEILQFLANERNKTKNTNGMFPHIQDLFAV